MHLPKRIAVAVIFAIIAVLASAPIAADIASAETAPSDQAVVTTTLHPGWNMVGWLGPDAPVSDLFEAIPGLRQVSAWNATEQRYERSTRAGATSGELVQISAGMGLWLRLRGDEPFEWTRPARTRSTLLALHTGYNLSGWAGRDDTAVGEALARLAGSLVRAHRWNGEEQAYARYRPGAPDAANTLAELKHGDALWVELREDARWWQSGRVPEPVVFLGEVSEDQQRTIRGWAEGAVAFYAERWAVEAPFSSYVGDIGALTPKYTEVRGAPPGRSLCADEASSVVIAVVDCVGAGTYPHEYFHALQSTLREYRDVFIPQWLIEGTASWAGELSVGLTSNDRTLAEHLDERRDDAVSAMVVNDTALVDIATYADFYAEGSFGYRKGFVATDWLVERSREEAVIGFFRQLAGERSWEEAFESSFGITASDFYEEFEAHVARVAPPLPHLTDDSDQPVLVLLGDIPQAREEEIRGQFAVAVELFEERLLAGSADYTVYIGAGTEPLADVYRLLVGAELPHDFCSSTGVAYLLTTVDCLGPLTFVRQHSQILPERLAPRASLAPTRDPYGRRGPHWLPIAIDAYAAHAYLQVVQTEAAKRDRAEWVRQARRAQHRLDDLTTDVSYPLSALAGELLAERAGEAALFDYYRRLPGAESWDAAFQAAFGRSVAEFHAEFEAYRAQVTAPYSLIRGHIRDPDGNPAVYAWVVADGRDNWEDLAETTSSGAFALAVRDGRYEIRVDITGSGCVHPADEWLTIGTTEVRGADVAIEFTLPAGSSCPAPTRVTR